MTAHVKTIIAALAALASVSIAIADPARPTAEVTRSTADECGVYAAALGVGPFKRIGLNTVYQDARENYEIRCKWASFGIVPPVLIGAPSPQCKAATGSRRAVADACGLPDLMISLSRPVFSDGGAKASLRADFVPTRDVIGGHGADCDFVKAKGKWRQVACREAWIS